LSADPVKKNKRPLEKRSYKGRGSNKKREGLGGTGWGTKKGGLGANRKCFGHGMGYLRGGEKESQVGVGKVGIDTAKQECFERCVPGLGAKKKKRLRWGAGTGGKEKKGGDG